MEAEKGGLTRSVVNPTSPCRSLYRPHAYIILDSTCADYCHCSNNRACVKQTVSCRYMRPSRGHHAAGQSTVQANILRP